MTDTIGYYLVPDEEVTNILWDRFKENKKGLFDDSKISLKTVRRMADLLFTSQKLTDEQIEEFEKFVHFEFSRHKCVTIREGEPDFLEIFIAENHLDKIGRREIVLMSDSETIKYSSDYKKEPEKVEESDFEKET